MKKVKYLAAYEVKAWEEEQNSKSKIRSFFAGVRKFALTAEDEKKYEEQISRRNRKYVYLMPYVSQEIKKATHQFATVKHERGRIFASDGSLLAGNDTVYSIAFLRKKFPSNETLRNEQISKVLQILGISDTAYDSEDSSKKVTKYGKLVNGSKNWIPVGYADSTQYMKLKKLKLDCLDADPSQKRSHPGNLAVDVLGIADYKMINNKRRREYGFGGQSGIEKVFEEDLMSREEEVDVQEHPENSVSGTAENAPRDIYVTIDRNLQQAAQDIMSEWAKKIRSELGLLIVQECDTGRIVALATTKQKPGQNVFAENVYEPGSTLKTITYAALIETKVATDETSVEVGYNAKKIGWEWRKGKFITDDHDSDTPSIDLKKVIAVSSNIGTAKLAKKLLKGENLHHFHELFGFGKKTGIESPVESKGLMAPLKKYKSDLSLLLTSSYGYGIAVTPVQLVSAYSAMVNGGLYHSPYLVDRITDRDGKTTRLIERPEPVRVISEETSAKVRNVLRGVMENGTGKDIKVDGYILAGKTGTADRLKGKEYAGGTNALFAGFFPYHKPKYAILAIFEAPEYAYRYGSKSPLPVYAEMSKRIAEIKHIPPDNPSALVKKGKKK
ncbi:MAG: penicillin-binding protein 2 [Elusimicrobiales bacterium]|nr:penicillin-binding protein 2 [Elusimicrobiales bacterium]